MPNSRHFLGLQCYILTSMNYHLECNCVCQQFKFCSTKMMKCLWRFLNLFFPSVARGLSPTCLQSYESASYFPIFRFRNLLKLHFDLTHQGPEKPSFLSYTCAPFLRLQALFPPLQFQNLHARLLYFPQPIKIHETEKLYTIKKDLVQIQQQGEHHGQSFLIHTQCQKPNWWKSGPRGVLLKEDFS